MNKNRKSLDEALSNMFSSTKYSNNAIFYGHLISKMQVKIDSTLPAPAGVGFHLDHYNLYINEDLFSEYSLNDRIFILIHECLHILNNHVSRKNDKDYRIWNYAADCAINQLIKSLSTPETAIMPYNLKVKDKQKVPKMATAETYYDLLLQENQDKSNESNEPDEDSENSNSSDGSNKKGKDEPKKSKDFEPLDTHETWEELDTDPQLQKDITKQMIEQAIDQTQKSRGNLPQEVSDWLGIFSTKSIVDWKKVLRNMVGNKKIGKRLTIMKKSRRFPDRPDIKGTTKDRKFELVCFVDISGSMSTEEILTGVNEIHHICKQTKTSMKLIQIDTEVHKVETFTKDTKLFERSGRGGTVMESGIKYLFENKIPHDGIIFITDGFIEKISEWNKQPKCVVMWLCTSEGQKIPGIELLKKHKQFNIDMA